MSENLPTNNVNPMDEDYFKEISMLQSELEEIDNLYSESKALTDKIKNDRTKGSLSFYKDMIEQLVSVKNLKLSTITRIIDTKNRRVNQELRKIAAGVGDGSGNEDMVHISKLASHLLDINGSSSNIHENAIEAEYTVENEQELDAKLTDAIHNLEELEENIPELPTDIPIENETFDETPDESEDFGKSEFEQDIFEEEEIDTEILDNMLQQHNAEILCTPEGRVIIFNGTAILRNEDFGLDKDLKVEVISTQDEEEYGDFYGRKLEVVELS